jgi:hypothetical protein
MKTGTLKIIFKLVFPIVIDVILMVVTKGKVKKI